MTMIVQSQATPHEIEQYTSGECHILAFALSRKYQWPLLCVEAPGEPFWEDPQDPDNYIPSVYHVYALSHDGQAWDICGSRSEHDVLTDVAERFLADPSSLTTDIYSTEAQMDFLVGCWGGEGEEPIDRPLSSYTDEDLKQAMDVLDRVLSPLIEQTPRISMG